MIAFFGGNDVKCAKFALPGSKKLSEYVIKSLNNRNACLLSNHGSIIVGSDFDEAYKGNKILSQSTSALGSSLLSSSQNDSIEIEDKEYFDARKRVAELTAIIGKK